MPESMGIEYEETQRMEKQEEQMKLEMNEVRSEQ